MTRYLRKLMRSIVGNYHHVVHHSMLLALCRFVGSFLVLLKWYKLNV